LPDFPPGLTLSPGLAGQLDKMQNPTSLLDWLLIAAMGIAFACLLAGVGFFPW
jgi:hypothetical protein